ncbi:hypothetical protein EDC01DRAFT_521676 [Geopyxis carbonaria]|nr:hypothetical protein EDC01DRAFT_521676 [Geopyxis carbonaria]
MNLIYLIVSTLVVTAVTAATRKCKSETFAQKPRVFVLSDISNEPDDQMSLVRLLLYSNQLSIMGLGATTSTWLNDTTHPEDMHAVVDGYSEVETNLRAHAPGYPSAKYLHSIMSSGATKYGTAALADGVKISEAARRLLSTVDESDKPLWVLVWGGANTLAQALYSVQRTRSAAAVASFVARLRVYAISDQDNTGAMLRRDFPKLFYIASVHAWNAYGLAAWIGISGETHYFGEEAGAETGANRTVVSQTWLKEHIQIGPLGKKYPDVAYIMEGDTPSQLYVFQNGLNVPEQPSWGGWGGRYAPVDVSAGTHTHHADIADTVSVRGRNYTSSQATIWRWREAFQLDMAARMQWTLTPTFEKANHAPVVVVNGTCPPEPLYVRAGAGEVITLDATQSWDPDSDDALVFKWWQYREPSYSVNWSFSPFVGVLGIDDVNAEKVTVTVPTDFGQTKCKTLGKGEKCQDLHLVLEVSDSSLVRYRRVVIQVYNV